MNECVCQFRPERIIDFFDSRIELKKSPNSELWGFSCFSDEGERVSVSHSAFSYRTSEITEFHAKTRVLIGNVEVSDQVQLLSFWDSDKIVAQSEGAIALFGIRYAPVPAKTQELWVDTVARRNFKKAMQPVGRGGLFSLFKNNEGSIISAQCSAEVIRVGTVDFLLEILTVGSIRTA